MLSLHYNIFFFYPLITKQLWLKRRLVCVCVCVCVLRGDYIDSWLSRSWHKLITTFQIDIRVYNMYILKSMIYILNWNQLFNMVSKFGLTWGLVSHLSQCAVLCIWISPSTCSSILHMILSPVYHSTCWVWATSEGRC